MIGVVTTAWGEYGRFLPEWAASLSNQSRRPDYVVVYCNGDRPSEGDLEAARWALDGIEHEIVFGDERLIMGAARNAAVEACPTDWVAHLDVDDVMLPHCLDDAEQLFPWSDVVSVGCIRDGKEVLFPRVSSEWILQGRQGAMSGSLFRRELWEQRPFITENEWVDSVFWVGLAHLGARFTPLLKPGFVYRQWDESHSHTISPEDKRAARMQHVRLAREWDVS